MGSGVCYSVCYDIRLSQYQETKAHLTTLPCSFCIPSGNIKALKKLKNKYNLRKII